MTNNAVLAELNIQTSPYGWLMLLGLASSIWIWSQMAKQDDRLLIIYVAGLIGAFVGAKVVYVMAEGWMHFGTPKVWQHLATGKSVLGALLGGYGGVELAKLWTRYPTATGDRFAIVVPIGIMFGRIGCYLHGCCLGQICAPGWFSLKDSEGIPRWPAVPMEFLFNAISLLILLSLRSRPNLKGQLFHLYLMAYGIFRLVHETMRNTPKILGPLSGYQCAAIGVFALGLVRFLQRRRGSDLSQRAAG